MNGHPRQVGANLRPFAAVSMAFYALFLEHFLACDGIGCQFGEWHQFVQNFLAIGIGQPTTSRQDFLCAIRQLPGGMSRQTLLLIE